MWNVSILQLTIYGTSENEKILQHKLMIRIKTKNIDKLNIDNKEVINT